MSIVQYSANWWYPEVSEQKNDGNNRIVPMFIGSWLENVKFIVHWYAIPDVTTNPTETMHISKNKGFRPKKHYDDQSIAFSAFLFFLLHSLLDIVVNDSMHTVVLQKKDKEGQIWDTWNIASSLPINS